MKITNHLGNNFKKTYVFFTKLQNYIYKKVHDLSYWLVNNKFLFRRLKISLFTFSFIKERDVLLDKKHLEIFQFNLI